MKSHNGEPTITKPVVRIREHQIQPPKTYDAAEIRDFREKHNFTLEIFSYLLGVSVHTLGSWEAGKTTPGNTVFRLLYLLEKKPDLFFEYEVISRKD